MDHTNIIDAVAKEAREIFQHEGSDHGWWHAWRVWTMSKYIGSKESADMFVVELAALLHDIADWKFYGGDESIGPRTARALLSHHDVPEAVIDHVCDIVADVGFKGAGVATPMRTLEGKVVQDADRLDALGAIGIARTFAYGGHANRPLYDPQKKPAFHQSREEYFASTGSTINHFYEKLLLLRNRMNTATARAIAEDRHRFMESYLERFLQEWKGEK